MKDETQVPQADCLTVPVGVRLDRLPLVRAHRVAVVVVGLGLFFDIYEVFLTGTLATVLGHQFRVGSDALKAILASAFVGQFLGAIALGCVADRLGRRAAYLLNLGVYSVFTLVAGLAPNVPVLVVARFAAGIGLGAELALADSYLAEILPARHRGRGIAWAYTIGFLGVPAVGFAARWLVPLHPTGLAGWRWLFLAGSLGAAAIWLARRTLPESPRWLASVGRREEAQAITSSWERGTEGGLVVETSADTGVAVRVPVTALFSRLYARRTAMAWMLSTLEVFGYYGFGTLAPLVLAAKGYTVLASLGYLALSYIGYPVGSALSLPIIERCERRLLIAASAAGIAVFGLLFAYASSPTAVVVYGFCYTLVANVFANAFHTYLGELYPTAIRATGAGAAYSLSRLATAALPYLLLPVLEHSGPGAVFSTVAVAMGLLILNVLILGPATTGRVLETV